MLAHKGSGFRPWAVPGGSLGGSLGCYHLVNRVRLAQGKLGRLGSKVTVFGLFLMSFGVAR